MSLPDSPRRIISFSPAVTETLFQIGLGDAMVGVSAFCARPDEARRKRVIGSYNTVDSQLLRELKPDVIFTVTGYQREFATRLSDQLPVYAFELPVSVFGIADMVVKAGLVTNRIDEANRIARNLLERLAETTPLSESPNVYVEIDFSGPVSFGAYSYITDALRLMAAKNIFGNEPREWLTPDLDTVKEKDPDVIIYEAKMYAPFTEKDLGNLLETRDWMDLRAVREGRVFMTPRPLDFLAHHGPSFITTAIPWINEKLRPLV